MKTPSPTASPSAQTQTGRFFCGRGRGVTAQSDGGGVTFSCGWARCGVPARSGENGSITFSYNRAKGRAYAVRQRCAIAITFSCGRERGRGRRLRAREITGRRRPGRRKPNGSQPVPAAPLCCSRPLRPPGGNRKRENSPKGGSFIGADSAAFCSDFHFRGNKKRRPALFAPLFSRFTTYVCPPP